LQHAPVLTEHFAGEQTMPKPRKSRPCCWQKYCVLMRQMPAA
jgi:hypothetical protein